MTARNLPPALDSRATLFHGGVIWTPDRTTEALLVADGVVRAVGAEALAATADRMVDLEGGFLMPSFGDGHAHPLFGGLESAGPAVRPCQSIDQIIAAVKEFADSNPDEEWIVGASYDGSLAPDGLFDARWLDVAVPDRPVVLRAWDYHTLWVNSVALQRAGITADSPEPVLGEIPRREDGTPLGTLREWGATDLITAVMPARDESVRIAALGTAADYYLARGVTWVQDAWVEPAELDTYLAAARNGALRMRFNLAFYADPRHFDTQITQYAAARDRVVAVGSPLLTAQTVKFFADGVVENETGALLEPYCSGLHSHGMQLWEGDALAEAARRVDELGLQIHIHAIGDAAVRQALDAIEYVAQQNGPRDRRPVIAHAQLVDDADLGRFAELGVIPNMQPLWAQMDALMTVLTIPRLGAQRADGNTGCAPWRTPVRHWLSDRIGRSPPVHRWTVSRSQCHGAPPTVSRRVGGRLKRSFRSGPPWPPIPAPWRTRPLPRTIGVTSHPGRVPISSGWTVIPDMSPRRNCQRCRCVPPISKAHRSIRPKNERNCHGRFG